MPGMAGMDCCKKAAQAEERLRPKFRPRVCAAPSIVRTVARLARPGLGFRALNEPSPGDSPIRSQPLLVHRLICFFELGTQPSSVFQSRLHSTPRSSDLETPRP